MKIGIFSRKILFQVSVLSILSLMTISTVCAQEKYTSKSIMHKDGREEVTYTLEEKKMQTNDTLEYYWHYANEIKMNQGGSSGNLLDGEYRRFDKNDNLITSGNFRRGLKTGHWKEWNHQGVILVHEEWKKGRKQGWQRNYNKGKLISKHRFKNGLLNGKIINYSDLGEPVIIKYRKGKLKIKKTKLEKIELKEVQDGTDKKVKDQPGDGHSKKVKKSEVKEKPKKKKPKKDRNKESS